MRTMILVLTLFVSTGTGSESIITQDTRFNGNYQSYRTSAARYGIPVEWVVSLAKIESDHNQDAVSGAGAIGVMQLMPETAEGCGVDPYVVEENIDCGVRVFAGHVRRYGSVNVALAAYNAGPGRVREYGGIPPFKETRRHIKKFWLAMKKIK